MFRPSHLFDANKKISCLITKIIFSLSSYFKSNEMKSLLVVSIKGLGIALLFICADISLFAQDCKNYYYMTNNAEVQMTLYDKNGTTSGMQTWKVSIVKKNGNSFQSSIVSTMTDAKGAEIARGNGVYKCDGGRLMADMRMSMPQDGTKRVDVGDAELGGSFAEYPVNISEGMTLPDAYFTMEATTTGIPSTTQFEMKNRKVTGRKKLLRVPARGMLIR